MIRRHMVIDGALRPVDTVLEVFMNPSHQGSAQASTHGSTRSSLADLRDEPIPGMEADDSLRDSGYGSHLEGEEGR
jgi:hypothetical protein